MLRTKKKQLNLKPNRFLDKRSSRGMLFENEELRLRTIHINDEVEKGQTDIKKLRKENEYLKREIWSLRDEVEKLEDVLKKVYSGDPPPINELPVYQPRVRKTSTISGTWGGGGGSRRASGVSMNFLNLSSFDTNDMDDNEREEAHDTETSYDEQQDQHDPSLLEQDLDEVDFEEEDIHNYDESLCQQQQQQQQNFELISDEDNQQHYNTTTIPNDDFQTQQQQKTTTFYSQNQSNQPVQQHHHHHHWHLHSPELEAVTEESENTSNSNNTSIIVSNNTSNESNSNGHTDKIETTTTTQVSIHNPPADASFIDSVSVHSETPIPDGEGGGGGGRGELDSLSTDNSYTLTPFFNPTIEITPASSSATPTPTSTSKQPTSESTLSGTGTAVANGHGSSNNNVNKLNNECSGSNDVVQDLGCVTLIPKKYQVTSELKITPTSRSNSMEKINNVPASQTGTEQEQQESPPLDSSSNNQQPCSATPSGADDDDEEDEDDDEEEEEENEEVEGRKNNSTHFHSRPQIPKRLHLETAKEKRHNFTHFAHPSRLPTPPPPQKSRPARLNFTNYTTTTTNNNNNSRTLSYYSSSEDSKFDKKKFQPLYQSEPSLSSLLSGGGSTGPAENNMGEADSVYLRVPGTDGWQYSGLISEGFNGYDQSVEMCARTMMMVGSNSNLIVGTGDNSSNNNNNRDNFYLTHGWNSVDKNVVIGYLDGGVVDETGGVTNNNNNNNINNSVSLFSDLSAQEVIDELETQFDPTLEKIAGVRMLTLPGYFFNHKPKRVFISLRTGLGVKMFLDKGFTVRGHPVRLIDACKAQTSVVILSGLPPSFPDATVISILNEFGQVTAPLERRAYKGVDISERLARMHLVKNFPGPAINIAGYEVVIKVVGFNNNQSSLMNNHSDANFENGYPSPNHVSPPPPPPPPLPPPSPGTAARQLTRTIGGANFRQNSSSSAVPPPPRPSTSPVLLTSVPFPPPPSSSSSSSGIPMTRSHKKVGKAASMASPPLSLSHHNQHQQPDTPTNTTGPPSLNHQSPHLHHHYLSSSPSSASVSAGTAGMVGGGGGGVGTPLGPTAAAINKRKMSVCSAVMDAQGCCISPNSPNTNPKTPGTPVMIGGGGQQQQKAYLGNPKKPLSRLPLRSSPGSLLSQQQQQQQFGPGHLADPNLMSVVDSTGVKPLVRSLSFEPRRISSGSNRGHGSESSLADSQQFQFHSQQFHQGHHGSIMIHSPTGAAAAAAGSGAASRQSSQQNRFYQPHGQLSHNNSSHSHFHSLDKNESLPWCGCWGNGCI